MANPTGAFGLRPVRHLDGSPWNGATVPCYVSASYAVAMFIGDPVLISPTTAERDATGRYQTINVSDGISEVMYGVITAFNPLPTDLTKIYNPASTARMAYVCTDRSVVFWVRGDGSGTPSKNYVSGNANLVATSAGSTVTGLSGFHLDETTPAATQTFNLNIVGVATKPDNDFSDNVIWEVVLNTQQLVAGSRLGVVGA